MTTTSASTNTERQPHASAETLVMAYYAALTDDRLEELDSLLAEDFEEHELVPGVPPTSAGLKQKYTLLRGGFPDLQFTIEDLVPQGDRVAVRVTVSGTHDGMFLGRPPTGRTFNVTSVGIFRISHHHVVEHWGVFDQMTMLRQLGGDQ